MMPTWNPAQDRGTKYNASNDFTHDLGLLEVAECLAQKTSDEEGEGQLQGEASNDRLYEVFPGHVKHSTATTLPGSGKAAGGS